VCRVVWNAELPASSILELFGKMFFEFCQDSGYDKILQVLGATPRDFLQVFTADTARAPVQRGDVFLARIYRIWTLCTITWARCIRA